MSERPASQSHLIAMVQWGMRDGVDLVEFELSTRVALPGLLRTANRMNCAPSHRMSWPLALAHALVPCSEAKPRVCYHQKEAPRRVVSTAHWCAPIACFRAPAAMADTYEAEDSSSGDSEQSKQWAASHEAGSGALRGGSNVTFLVPPADRRLVLAADTTMSDEDLRSEVVAAETVVPQGVAVLPAVRAPSGRAARSDTTTQPGAMRPQHGIRLKCKHGTDIRVVAVSTDMSFQALYTRLVHDYGFELTVK